MTAEDAYREWVLDQPPVAFDEDERLEDSHNAFAAGFEAGAGARGADLATVLGYDAGYETGCAGRESLQAEVQRLREALQDFADSCDLRVTLTKQPAMVDTLRFWRDAARRVLAGDS